MRKKCSRSKSCGAGCISNSKFCRINFPTAVNNVLNKASHEVGVVELYRAAAAGGKRGGAAQFEKIKKQLRGELGHNIRAGEDAKELKRRLIEAGVIPKNPAKSTNEPPRLPSDLRQEIAALAANAQQQKDNKPDPLYGAWGTNDLAKFRKGLSEAPAGHKELFQVAKSRIDRELARREENPSEKPLLVQPPRQPAKSPDGRVPTAEVFDDISRILRGETPQNIAIVSDDRAVPRAKSQIAQLQSALGLGAKTRKEIGRDLEGLLEEAWNLRNNLKSEMRQENPKGILVKQMAKQLKDVEEAIQGAPKGGSPQNKSQIAQLQSVLGLGAQTRKEVGRDLEGLLEEANNLRERLQKEQKSAIARGANATERFEIIDRIQKVQEAILGPATKATGNVRYAREDARDHDGDLLAKGITKELGSKNYKWEESYGSGSTLLGKGAYGTVLREPNKGNAIKRGEIGLQEADLIKRLGEADLGPRLLAAQIDGEGYHPGTKLGRLAMGVVPGKPIGGKDADKEINGVKVADAYWIARANLHRMGIAHNDMHIDNVLIDNRGTARFVDMGLAQDSPKAALSEAMGAFMKPQGAMVSRDRDAGGQGDWQVRRWDGTGGTILNKLENETYRGNATGKKKFQEELEKKAPILARVRDNRPAVLYEMRRDGFTNDDIATIMDHGIRSPGSSYERGPWGRMSTEQAQKYINILYEGTP